MLSGNVGNKKATGRNREPFPKWGGEGETRALFVSKWDSFPKRSLTGFVAEMLPSSKPRMHGRAGMLEVGRFLISRAFS